MSAYTIKDVIDHRSQVVKDLVARFTRECPPEYEYLTRLDEELNIIEYTRHFTCWFCSQSPTL